MPAQAISKSTPIIDRPTGIGRAAARVVIEPGPVATRFGETATEPMKQLLRSLGA